MCEDYGSAALSNPKLLTVLLTCQQSLGNSGYFNKKEIITASTEIWENRQRKEKEHAYGLPVSGSLSSASQLMLTV